MRYSEFKKLASERGFIGRATNKLTGGLLDKIDRMPGNIAEAIVHPPAPNPNDPNDVAIRQAMAKVPMRTDKLFSNMAKLKPADQKVYATSVIPMAVGLQQFANGGSMTAEGIAKNPNIQKGLASGAVSYTKELLTPHKLIAGVKSKLGK